MYLHLLDMTIRVNFNNSFTILYISRKAAYLIHINMRKHKRKSVLICISLLLLFKRSITEMHN